MNIQELENIPIIFKNFFPLNYINDVSGWGLNDTLLHSKNNTNGIYNLLSIDLDFGESCSLSCPHCFRKNFNNLKDCAKNLAYSEIISILSEALKLGLKYVKIIGAGEPFENPKIIDLIDFLSTNDIVTSVFTKGHIIGNDNRIKELYKDYNISDSITLLQYLKKRGVSVLLGFNSFNSTIQGQFVGIYNKEKQEEYIKYRNKALLNAVKCGFNDYIEGASTRLALIAAPIKPENIKDIFDIFKFGRKRNIYVLSCPTALSGLGKIEYDRESKLLSMDKYIDQLVDLYIRIYSWCIEKNLIKISEIEERGISLYPGCHPCNQVAGGFYMTTTGKLFSCPGRDTNDYVITDNILDNNLTDIWTNSYNYQLASQEDKFNFYCTARDGYFFKSPKLFYKKIENALIKKYKSKKNIENLSAHYASVT